VKENEVGRICVTNGEKINVYRVLMGKPEGKRQLGRPKRTWVDNIKTYLRGIGWGGTDWSYLAGGLL
jgi:hypothetical protein